MTKTIYVSTATGQQGSALVKANETTPDSYKILAATRDPSSEAAKKLSELPGVTAVKADFDDLASFFSEPIDGFFLLLHERGENEVAEGKKIIDLAKKNGVKHLVYSGVDLAGGGPNPPINGILTISEAKREIGEYLKSSGLPYTILSPTGLMENFHNPWMAKTVKQSVMTYFSPNVPRQLIATSDIGRVAFTAFAEPDKFTGKQIGLAGDSLLPAEIAAAFKEVKGEELPNEQPELSPYIKQYFDNENPFQADVQECKSLFPWIKDFKTWLKEEYQG